MDLQDFSGLPYPAMPVEARVALILAKYAMFGMIPLIVPTLVHRRADADRPHPDARGHRPRVHRTARARDRLRLLHRARAGAGHEHRLLRAADQDRRAAAGAQHRHGRAHQRRVAVVPLRDRGDVAADRDHPERRSRACRFRSRSPTSTRCSRRSAAIPPPITNITVLRDTAKLSRWRRRSAAASRRRRGRRTPSPANGIARRAALRPRAAGARQLVGVRGAGLAFDGLYYVEQRHAARSSAASSSRASRCRATGIVSLTAGGAGMSTGQLLRQVPRHGAEQHRPDADGPPAGAGARRHRPDAGDLGDAVRAGRRHPERACSRCRRSAPASGSSSSRATPTIRSGSAASGAARAEVPALARLTPPGVPAITLQTPLQNGLTHQRPARARPAGSCSRAPTGATLIVNDTGIYIQNGKGASIVHDRPDGDRSTPAR